MLHYLAYGSNLHPLRLLERVPSSRLLGSLLLPGYKLAFHKLGQDSSGKCNIVNTSLDTDHVHAALFALDNTEKTLLDGFEGAGYGVEEIELQWQGELIRPFVYIADAAWIDDSLLPYQWYRDIVAIGARYLDLPVDYVDSIECQRAVDDLDEARRLRHQQLIERMCHWSGKS